MEIFEHVREILSRFEADHFTHLFDYQGDRYLVIVGDEMYQYLIRMAISTYKTQMNQKPKKIFIRIDTVGSENHISNSVPTEQLEKYLPVYLSEREIDAIYSSV